jgi:hypothetical protein
VKVSQQLRQAYDQDFMQMLTAVRVEVLGAKAPAMAATSPVAAMFFKEAQQSALRELAELTAGWNRNEVDLAAVDRALAALDGMGLSASRERLAALKDLASQDAG